MNVGILFENPLYLFFLLLCPCIIITSHLIKSLISEKSKTLSLIMRLLVLCLFICAISGMNIAMNENIINYIFLLDVSESIQKQTKDSGLNTIKNYMEKKKKSDTITLIPFAGNAHFEIEFQKKPHTIRLPESIDSNGTNIEKAIQLACAHLPGKGENRIVLFSDGNETNGSLIRGARLAKACGVSISIVPLDSQIPEQEVLIKKIYGPSSVKQDEPRDISIIIESSGKSAAFLTLLKDNTPLLSTRIELQQGENFYKVTSTLKENGLHTYEGIVYTEDDEYQENNVGKLYVHVKGRPEILYIYASKGNSSLINALTSHGIDVTSIPYPSLPLTLAGLSGYSGIIFDTIPCREIPFEISDRIEEYVRATGGGFFMITGQDTYGLSGFSSSKIARLLPTHLINQEKFSSLAVVFAIDRSASMIGDIDIGKTKLDVVKNALLTTVDTLKPTESIGVMVFDNEPEWIITFEDSINRDQVKEKISTISSGGGTNIFRALQDAYRILAHFPAKYRHIVLLSDGKSEKRENYDYAGLLSAIAQDNISFSTIAIGYDADEQQLAQIAAWGKWCHLLYKKL